MRLFLCQHFCPLQTFGERVRRTHRGLIGLDQIKHFGGEIGWGKILQRQAIAFDRALQGNAKG